MFSSTEKNLFENKQLSNYDRVYIALNRAAVLSFQGETNPRDFERKQAWLLNYVMTVPVYAWATAEGLNDIVRHMAEDELIRQVVFSITTRVFAELSLEGFQFADIVKVIFNCIPTCGEEKNNVLHDDLSSRFITVHDFIEFFSSSSADVSNLNQEDVASGRIFDLMPGGLSGANRWMLAFPLLSIFGSIDSIRSVRYLGEAS